MADDSSNSRILDITPDVSLFRKMGRSRFTLETALPEFIDNCLDSWWPGLPKLVVHISLDRRSNTVQIVDTSGGLDLRELRQSLVIGLSPSKASREPIGENGFGLKAAAAFIGRTMEIVTRKVNLSKVYRVVLNQSEFEQAGKWELPYDELGVGVKPDHGTIITLSDLNVDLKAVDDDRLRTHLSVVYRGYLERGQLSLLVDEVELQSCPIAILERRDFSFSLPSGKAVYGWVGARDPRGVSRFSEAGFELIHRGRLIRRGEWIGQKKTQRLRHLVGEIHLDQFEVNNNKTDFVRDTAEWAELEAQMAETLGKDNLWVNEWVYNVTYGKRVGKASPEPAIPELVSPTSPSSASPAPAQLPPVPNNTTTAPAQPSPHSTFSRNNSAPSAIPSSRFHGLAKRPRFVVPKKDSLSFSDIHPIIRAGCEQRFRQGYVRDAVREAFDLVNQYVRAKISQVDDGGVDMMRQVFNPDTSNNKKYPASLEFGDYGGLSKKNDQEGFQNIFAGVQMALRNPLAHGRSEMTSSEALEYLAFASLLCRKIDRARVVPTTPPQKP
jgi:uncharacterized protein (TIGR02391 family)